MRKEEFEAGKEQIKNSLMGYRDLITNSDKDKYLIMDYADDVSIFVRIEDMKNDVDQAIREFNDREVYIGQTARNLDTTPREELSSAFDNDELDLNKKLKSIIARHSEYFTTNRTVAMVEHELSKSGIITYIDYILFLLNNITPIDALNVQRPFTVDELIRIDKVKQTETTSRDYYVKEYEKYHDSVEEALLNIDVYFIYNEIITVLQSAIKMTLFQ